jgi:hypothetical protein
MWDLRNFSADTLLLSLKSFILDCPASDLTKITSWRMRNQPVFSTPVDFAEPILVNLTSLHALEPLNSIEETKIGIVLEKCTALKQLYYCASDLNHLEIYLFTQPKLQALAVQIESSNSDSDIVKCCFRVSMLVANLEHKPDTICVLARLYNNESFHPSDWAQGVKKVVLSDMTPPIISTSQARIDWFNKTVFAPLDCCWMLKDAALDPFTADSLPYIAEIMGSLHPSHRCSGEATYAMMNRSLPADCPTPIWAASYNYIMLYLCFNNDFGTRSKEIHRNAEVIAKLLQQEVERKLQGLEDSPSLALMEYFHTWLAVAVRGTSATLPSGFPPSMRGRLPSNAEWAIDRLRDFAHIHYEPSTRASFAKYWELDRGFEYCLFTGDATFATTAPVADRGADPKTKVFSGDYRPLETAIFNKCVKGFDKLFSSKRDLPNEVMVGVWLFLMHARSPVTKEVYAYFAEWEPQRVKILQRASAEVLTLLRDSMDVKIITAYLSLMAAHNNWDGFLGSAVYLQKQKYPAKDIGSCLNIAVMIAFYKMGSPDKAKKAADRELYTGPYFTLL